MKFIVATVLLATCITALVLKMWVYYYTHDRNITGTPSEGDQFPYLASIWQNWRKGDKIFCPGALISSRWVLTGALCVRDVLFWDIKLGSICIDQTEPGQVVLRSYEGIVHQDFNKYFNNDIALIELPEAVSFTNKIQPLRLPRRSEAGDRLENIRVRISRLQKINDSAPEASIYKSYIDLDTITNAECEEVFGPLMVIEATLCCKGRPELNPCKDDYGAPLVRTADDGHLTHVGIASFVPKDGCASGQPLVYIRTASYLDWISEHTGIPIRP